MTEADTLWWVLMIGALMALVFAIWTILGARR